MSLSRRSFFALCVGGFDGTDVTVSASSGDSSATLTTCLSSTVVP